MRRIPQLDGLRAAAILMVFGTHALGIPLLWAGVDLFFVLSGYLITGILLSLKERQSSAGYFRHFYQRRAYRILPSYLLFLMAVTLLFHLRWIIWLWCGLFSANVGLAFGKINDSVLTPLWSLAVEEQFYLLWPVVVLLCDVKMLKRVAVVVIVASPCIRALATPLFLTHFPIYFLTLFRGDALCAGAFICISEGQGSHWIQSHRRAALIATAAATLLFALLSTHSSFRTGADSLLFNSLGYSLITVFFAGVLVITLGLRLGFAHSLLVAAPLRYLGRISYSFYLWHWAVLIVLANYIHLKFPFVLMAFVVTAIISALSWELMERPILRHRNPERLSACVAPMAA